MHYPNEETTFDRLLQMITKYDHSDKAESGTPKESFIAMKNTLRQITDKVNNVKAVSSNTIQILNLIAKSDYRFQDLVGLVAQDLTLTVRCLQIVNSAEFGLRKSITSVERAVSFLGNRAILALVVKKGFGDIFFKPLEGLKGNENDLWNHSLRTAIASRQIAYLISEPDIADVAYTGGLLHDIGKVIISEFLAKSEKNFSQLFDEGVEFDFPTFETNVLRINHAEVGFMLAHKWEFPDILKMIIRNHLNPSSAPTEYKKVCSIVHLGDIMSMLGGFGTGMDTLAYKIDPVAMEILKISEYSISKLYLDVDLEFSEVTKAFYKAS